MFNKFGICPCCSVSGGIYDFYTQGGVYLTAKSDQDASCAITRRPSAAPRILNYPNLPSSIEAYTEADNVITSFYDGWQIPMWTGQKALWYDVDNDLLYDNFGGRGDVVSMNRTDKEYIWTRFMTPTGNDSYDYFGFSGITSVSGRVVGPSGNVTGNSLFLTTSGITSGAYVKWNFTPNIYVDGTIAYIDFDETYDKYVLMRQVFATGSSDIWFKPNIAPETNSRITCDDKNDSGTCFTGNNSFRNVKFKANEDDAGYRYRWYFFTDNTLNNDRMESLELRMVDSLLAYTIDDVSGLELKIHDFKMPYTTGYFGIDEYDLHLQSIDAETKTLDTRITINTSGSYYTDIISSDYYTYHSNVPSGSTKQDWWMDADDFFRTSLFEDFSDSFYSWSFNDGFGTVVLYAPPVDTIDFGLSVAPLMNNYSRPQIVFNNSGIARAEFPFWDFGQWGTELGSTYSMRQYFPGANVSNFMIDSSKGQKQSLIVNYISGVQDIDYEARFPHSIVEYDVPVAEKIRRMECEATAGATPETPISLSNYNTATNLPKINFMDNRNYPNCFSVLQPKRNFITGTGTALSGSLNQEVSILYGPYTSSDFTVDTITGQTVGFTASLGNFSGSGGVRPHTSFTYRTGSISAPQCVGGTYPFTFRFNYGNYAASDIFWTDSLTQNVNYARYFSQLTSSGIFASPPTLNVTAQVIRGGKHLASNKIGCSFIHSRNYTSGLSISGQTYLKLKIDSNIVFDRQIIDGTYLPGGSLDDYSTHLLGPYILHTTEDAQKSTMSGDYAAFVWFERLWPSGDIFYQTGTGWKMHVANQTGTDLWTSSYTGLTAYDNDLQPRFIDSSDRYFYVTFSFPYKDLDYNLSIRTATSGSILSGVQHHFIVAYGPSGLGRHFAFSHNGQSVIPCGYDDNPYTITPLGLPSRTVPSNGDIKRSLEVRGHSIKNSSKLSKTPTLEDWMYDRPQSNLTLISGFDVYLPNTKFSATNYNTNALETGTRAWVSNTGFNTGEYVISGFNPTYIHQNLPYIYAAVNSVGGRSALPIYLYSGIRNSGWLNL